LEVSGFIRAYRDGAADKVRFNIAAKLVRLDASYPSGCHMRIAHYPAKLPDENTRNFVLDNQ
jgi:hypothetical protein